MNVPYQIIKSDRKTIAIQIKPDGQVVVRCPKRMRIEEARRFVESKADWIEKHLAKRSTHDVVKYTSKEIEQLRAELSQLKTGDLMSGAVDLGGVTLVATTVEGVNPGDLRSMCDKVKEHDNAVAVICGINGASANFACACGKGAIAKGAHAGNIVREVSKLAGGSGGGRPDSATAGGKDASKLDEALQSVYTTLKDSLK